MPKMRALAIICLFLISTPTWAQVQDSTEVKNLVLPLLFYLPETSLGLGATGITTFKKSSHTEETRPSQVLYSAVYTLKKQLLLFVPFEFYGNNNKSRIKGELGYYRYFYNYFGIGRETNRVDKDNYNVNFPRIDFNYAQKVFRNIYAGIGFNFDQFDLSISNTEGLLATEKPQGYLGGTKANFVAVVFSDFRDNIFSPSKGYYIEVKAQNNLPFLSDYTYQKIEADFRIYNSFQKLTLASQIYYGLASDNAPFFDLPYISTPSRSRGYDDRRFINHSLLSVQTELRFPIYNKWKGAAFVSLADVPDGSFDFFHSKPAMSYGLGIRYELDAVNKTRLRLDLAATSESFNIYFTVNEAF